MVHQGEGWAWYVLVYEYSLFQIILATKKIMYKRSEQKKVHNLKTQ